jgi:hypothetical protein
MTHRISPESSFFFFFARREHTKEAGHRPRSTLAEPRSARPTRAAGGKEAGAAAPDPRFAANHAQSTQRGQGQGGLRADGPFSKLAGPHGGPLTRAAKRIEARATPPEPGHAARGQRLAPFAPGIQKRLELFGAGPLLATDVVPSAYTTAWAADDPASDASMYETAWHANASPEAHESTYEAEASSAPDESTHEASESSSRARQRITPREFGAYRLHPRGDASDPSSLFRTGRLFKE